MERIRFITPEEVEEMLADPDAEPAEIEDAQRFQRRLCVARNASRQEQGDACGTPVD